MDRFIRKSMDILKEFLTPFSLATIASASLKVLLAFVLGVVVANVYRWTHTEIAQKTFTDTLIILAMIVAVVMVVIGESVARAFSLVGALSIIRFRSAVQDPRDIAFVFLALAVGMAVGAGDPAIAIIGTFLIGGIIIGIHQWHVICSAKNSAMLTFRVPPDPEHEQIYRPVFSKHLTADRLISQRITKSGTIELEFHVKLKQPEQWLSFFHELTALEAVEEVKLTRE